MALEPAPPNISCPKCGVTIKYLSPPPGQPLALVDESACFCLDCASPLVWRGNRVVALTPVEICQKVMTLGDDYCNMWTEIKLSVEVGRKAVGL